MSKMDKLILLTFFICLVNVAVCYECLNSVCSSSHRFCEISVSTKGLHGTCHTANHDLCEDYNYQPTAGQKCRCQDATCVSKVMKNLNTMECFGHYCYGNQYCHIYNEEDDTLARCTTQRSHNFVLCKDHESVTQHSSGCYCNSTVCASKLAIHALGVICRLSQVLNVHVQHGHVSLSCITPDDDIDDKPKCHIPFVLGHNSQSCYCSSQECANGVARAAHPTISTATIVTTTLATTILLPTTSTTSKSINYSRTNNPVTEYPTCINMKCDKYKPYCHMYQFNKKPEGTCMPFLIGPLCSTYQDVKSLGCSCKTTTCVISAYSSFNIILDTTTTHPMTTVATANSAPTTLPLSKSTTSTSTKYSKTKPPTIIEYPFCISMKCDKFKPYCHLFRFDFKSEGTCMPFRIGPICSTYKDIESAGCSCKTTNCVISSLASVHLAPDTTTRVQTTSSEPSMSTSYRTTEILLIIKNDSLISTTRQSTQSTNPAITNSESPKTTEHPAIINRESAKTTEHPAIINHTSPKTTEHATIMNRETPKTTEHPVIINRESPKTTEHPAIINHTSPKTTEHTTIMNSESPKTTEYAKIINNEASKSMERITTANSETVRTTERAKIINSESLKTTERTAVITNRSPTTTEPTTTSNESQKTIEHTAIINTESPISFTTRQTTKHPEITTVHASTDNLNRPFVTSSENPVTPLGKSETSVTTRTPTPVSVQTTENINKLQKTTLTTKLAIPTTIMSSQEIFKTTQLPSTISQPPSTISTPSTIATPRTTAYMNKFPQTTIKSGCEDAPGVDCDLLINSINICSLSTANHYCARSCEHCTVVHLLTFSPAELFGDI